MPTLDVGVHSRINGGFEVRLRLKTQLGPGDLHGLGKSSSYSKVRIIFPHRVQLASILYLTDVQ